MPDDTVFYDDKIDKWFFTGEDDILYGPWDSQQDARDAFNAYHELIDPYK